MNSLPRTRHSIDAVFSVLLFGIFSLMLLLLILFSAETYRVSVKNLEENQNLHTAMTYITTKLRQHDGQADISLGEIEGIPALCLQDTLEEKTYTTYIYLHNQELKELVAVPEAVVSIDLGTTIAELWDFRITETEGGFFQVFMEDFEHRHSEVLLHPTPPKALTKENPS